MSEYNFKEIEANWQKYWEENSTFQADENSGKQPYYVLDMFPYPSGAGLHVGHPLGYIASDVIARFHRHKGYEVLHPMGYDAFGLPAEQYAIETGNHPGSFTDQNIERYRKQLKMIGLSYDWSREVKTSDPQYYKWTQWIFNQLFDSWYDEKANVAKPIEILISEFHSTGNLNLQANTSYSESFTAIQWEEYDNNTQQKILMHYRLAYLGVSEVNWCEELGTVLANEEVKDGLSERGGYPVIKKEMTQWFLRILAYADRLLVDLNKIDWPEATKEMQRNWIGKSQGAELQFEVENHNQRIKVFTTRPDTIFGVTFMVLAPEHELVLSIVSDSQKESVIEYTQYARNRSQRDRMADVKNITGVFTGAYALHPYTSERLPIWISDYVLADYGTGAVMAVPAHDTRDYGFAKQFQLSITYVVDAGLPLDSCIDSKAGTLFNSDFLNGLQVADAVKVAINSIKEKNIGIGKVNYKLRDANFSRQRYWGEPFPIVYQNGVPTLVDTKYLPVSLPNVDSYLPSGTGESPLARAESWVNTPNGVRETDTMPGWAGSSWYFLRYMDPHNEEVFCSPEREAYWGNVDFYIGGSEHATVHLLFARFWQKFLFDRGFVTKDEPFQKLINQGMIQGRSSLAYRINKTNTFVSANLKDNYETTALHIDISMVDNDVLHLDSFRNWRKEYKDSEFILEGDKFICGYEVEKMSKRWYNVVTPDEVISKYGCDAFRLYEMFLGPIESSKPWETKGIDGVSRFLKKLWGLIYSTEGKLVLVDEPEKPEDQKILHKGIKKLTDDINRFSLNTCVSNYMILVNELTANSCHTKSIIEQLAILLSPFAPHVSEEIWKICGHTQGLSTIPYPVFNPDFLIESEIEYPVSVNGKTRFKIVVAADAGADAVKQMALQHIEMGKWLAGKEPKKIIVVTGRIVNVVV
ncbi:MAG: leucine--tRNA ligase [Bacteroidota bacterium]|nr:leucine--tRNA ligase [Bacteroidota bacterium]